MSETKKDLSSVRLSTLSVDVRSKLAKFDASNEGELTIEDLMHAVVTLQKQSNNYKRILYIVLPVMLILIASIFGTTILAINLTRDMKTNSDGLLVSSSSNTVISTAQAVEYSSFLEWILSDNPEDLRQIQSLEFQNIILPIQGVFVSENTTTIGTEFFYLIADKVNSTIEVEIKTMYKDDKTAQMMVENIESQMGGKVAKYAIDNELIEKWNIFEAFAGLFVQKKPPGPAAAYKPSCSPSGVCSSPKPI